MISRKLLGVVLSCFLYMGVLGNDSELTRAITDLNHVDGDVRKHAEEVLLLAGDMGLTMLRHHYFPDVDTLLTDLETGDYKARRRARERLMLLGKSLEKRLRAKMKTSNEPELIIQCERILTQMAKSSTTNGPPSSLNGVLTFVLNHHPESPSTIPFLGFYLRNYRTLPKSLRNRLTQVERLAKGHPELKGAIKEGIRGSTRSDLPILSRVLKVAFPDESSLLKHLRYERGLTQAANLDLSVMFPPKEKRRAGKKTKEWTLWSRKTYLEEKGFLFLDEIPMHVYALLLRPEQSAHTLALEIMDNRELPITRFTPQLSVIIRNVAKNRDAESDQYAFFGKLRQMDDWKRGLRPLSNELLDSLNPWAFGTGVRLLTKPTVQQIAKIKTVMKKLAGKKSDYSHWRMWALDEVVESVTGMNDFRATFKDIILDLLNSSKSDMVEAGFYLAGADLRSHDALLERLIANIHTGAITLEAIIRYVPDREEHFKRLLINAAKDDLAKNGLEWSFRYDLDDCLNAEDDEFTQLWKKWWKADIAPTMNTEDGHDLACDWLDCGMSLKVSPNVLLPLLRDHKECCAFCHDTMEHLFSVEKEELIRVSDFYTETILEDMATETLKMWDDCDYVLEMHMCAKTPRAVASLLTKRLHAESTASTEYLAWSRPVALLYPYGISAISRCPDTQLELVPLLKSKSVDVRVMAAEALFRCDRDRSLFLPAIKNVPIESCDHHTLESIIFILAGCGESAASLAPYYDRYLSCVEPKGEAEGTASEYSYDDSSTLNDRIFEFLGPKDTALLPIFRKHFKRHMDNANISGGLYLADVILHVAPNDKKTIERLTSCIDSPKEPLTVLNFLCHVGHPPKLSNQALEVLYETLRKEWDYDVLEAYQKDLLPLVKERVLMDFAYAVSPTFTDHSLLCELGVTDTVKTIDIDEFLRNLKQGHVEDRHHAVMALDMESLTNDQILEIYGAERSLNVLERMNDYWFDEIKPNPIFAKAIERRMEKFMTKEFTTKEFTTEEDKLSFRCALTFVSPSEVDRKRHLLKIIEYATSLDYESPEFSNVFEVLSELDFDESRAFLLKALREHGSGDLAYHVAYGLAKAERITPELVACFVELSRRYGAGGVCGSSTPSELFGELTDNVALAIAVLPHLEKMKFEYRATEEYRDLLQAIDQHKAEKAKTIEKP